MKWRAFIYVAVVGILFSSSAWSLSSRDIINSKQSGEGETRIYHVDKEHAWEIAHAVLYWQHANPIEDHRDVNYMLTIIGIPTCACRTEVGVWIEPESEQDTRVTIVTKGRSNTNQWTNLEMFPDKIKPDFHSKFEKGVQIIKSGKELPFVLR